MKSHISFLLKYFNKLDFNSKGLTRSTFKLRYFNSKSNLFGWELDLHIF